MSGFFDLPAAALEADIATVAQKGGGKTYTNKRLVERLLAKGRRVCVLDPLNNWWGLQGRADGTPGYPILVIGGPNADVPLDPTKGVELAAFVARSDVSVVIDVSDLRKSDLISFATAFLNELYRINRDPLWLVLEEADVFAPQNPSADGSRAMHDAADQIARRGRQRGFRLWTITQRPARLSKDLLTQASTLILLRIRGPQDRNAAADWVKGHAETEKAREVIDSLASLKVGEGWVYSPDFDLVERVRFPPIETLDTSRTPQAGDKARKGTQLAKPDVEALRVLMTDTGAEPAPAKGEAPKVDHDAEKRAFEAGRVAGREEGEASGRFAGQMDLAEAMLDLIREKVGPPVLTVPQLTAEEIERIRAAPTPPGMFLPVDRVTGGHPGPKASGPRPPVPSGGSSVMPPPAPEKAPRKPAAPRRPSAPGELSEGAATLVQAARQAHRQVTWPEACLLAGKMPNSGYQRGVLKELRDAGFVEPPPNDMADEGLLYGPTELRAMLGAGLGTDKGPARAFFDFIWANGPTTKAQTCEVLGVSPVSGYTRKGWKALNGNARLHFAGDQIDLAPVLREVVGPSQ